MEERIVKRIHRIADFETFEVTSDELDSIERGYSSRQNDVAFLGISASVFASFLLTLITVIGREPTAVSQFYWAVTVTSGFATGYFWYRWRSAVARERPIFLRIRDRAIGPLGEEGKEIKPSELENLPTVEPKRE